MATEQVRMWRPADERRVLLMAGQTTRYAMEPRGEYVFGVVARQPMRSRRGREHRLVEPGQLVAWDLSGPHAGTAVDARPWSARLMLIHRADLVDLASDHESDFPAEIVFPEPVIRDSVLARAFLQLHVALERSTTRLERDERLASWLQALIERFSAARPRQSPLPPRDRRALRTARDYLAERPERNVGLDELAAVTRTPSRSTLQAAVFCSRCPSSQVRRTSVGVR
jgi:AraC-like ligand binding domain